MSQDRHHNPTNLRNFLEVHGLGGQRARLDAERGHSLVQGACRPSGCAERPPGRVSGALRIWVPLRADQRHPGWLREGTEQGSGCHLSGIDCAHPRLGPSPRLSDPYRRPDLHSGQFILNGGWTTGDAREALAYLKRFGSVTVLNGHVHQVRQKIEGHMTYHTAVSRSPSRPRGRGPGRAPLKVPTEEVRRLLGLRSVTYSAGREPLAIVDSTLG